MLVFERQQKILDLLEEKRIVTVDQLCSELFASGATIRRDLAEMHKQGLLTRVRGGAVAGDSVQNDKPFLMRTNENKDKKLALCHLARKLVHDSSTLMMDSSSTVAMLASMLGDVRGLSVVTNGLKTVNALTEHTDATIYCSGGIIQDTSSMRGQTALSTIAQYNADIVFFSCKGLDARFGVSESSEENAQIKRRMLQTARRRVLLCDSSKFGKSFFCKICSFSEIDILITDMAPPASLLEGVRCEIIYPRHTEKG